MKKTKVITIAQLKGGSGKSAISTNLAGILSKDSLVALIDSDQPQFTSSGWMNVGPEKENIQLAQVDTPELMIKAVEHFDGKVDYIVIDLAPRLEHLTRAGIALSNLTIVPVAMQAAEVWALDQTKELMKEAEEKIEGFKYRILANRFTPGNKEQEELKQAIIDSFGCPFMESHLNQRKAIHRVTGQGITLLDQKDPKAKDEMLAIVKEVKALTR